MGPVQNVVHGLAESEVSTVTAPGLSRELNRSNVSRTV